MPACEKRQRKPRTSPDRDVAGFGGGNDARLATGLAPRWLSSSTPQVARRSWGGATRILVLLKILEEARHLITGRARHLVVEGVAPGATHMATLWRRRERRTILHLIADNGRSPARATASNNARRGRGYERTAAQANLGEVCDLHRHFASREKRIARQEIEKGAGIVGPARR